ncbi:endonuclease/exonuclease/phosphatase [Delitschia confertaspora ATCC 74209]|uniref:Endonuclease/exonuclease/phosphatase n=1 Tax=Delitschia confertaspora ATCC 74209 TaxID=1513339 RepID=A0A9P4MUG7_9PLEO|nr:endonuclease/exonuclease/phosphatase [Delitschia confertaspora ATCC 74209]
MKSNPPPTPIRLITHNIRYATSHPFPGELPWTDRKQLIINSLYFHTLHSPESFICLQEVLHSQLLQILVCLNQLSSGEWKYIGVGRDDGQEAGEYCPIIYCADAWKLVTWRTIWLSQTPDRPSKGWDAASIRIMTLGVWRHWKSDRRVMGCNTHLDDQGEWARTAGAKLIVETIQDYMSGMSAEDPLPVFLGGDLNSGRSGHAYRVLTGQGSPLRDARGLAAVQYGEKNTFTGFNRETRPAEIDHLFVGPNKYAFWQVRAYAVLPNRFEDGVYSSDHRPVVVETIVGNLNCP